MAHHIWINAPLILYAHKNLPQPFTVEMHWHINPNVLEVDSHHNVAYVELRMHRNGAWF
jgi:hypothetical protein